jgi:hypothetical protein
LAAIHRLGVNKEQQRQQHVGSTNCNTTDTGCE